MNLRNLVLLGVILFTYGCGTSLDPTNIPIQFELSGGTRTSNYEQTIEFCNKVAEVSPKIRFISIGKTPQGRQIPMLIIDQKENFTPTKVHNSGNAVLIIQANIHAGEPDGNDAGMLLIKRMIAEKSYPHNVTILFLPVVNPDGLARFGAYNRINQNGPEEVGWRVTAQNLDLNRDFIKADAPEMQYWLKMYNTWMPDFFIDCHVTDGADFQYVITYIMETLGNMNPAQTKWQNKYLDHIKPIMHEAGYPMFPYVSFREWHNPRSGLYSRPAPPMMSNGYSAIQNRVELLVEAHSLKPYSTRVYAILKLFEETIAYIEADSKNLIKLGKDADKQTEMLAINNDSVPLTYKLLEINDSVDFEGIEYDMVESDLTGGEWFVYHTDKPKTFRLPYLKRVEADMWAKVPSAFILGPEWGFVRQRLDCHKISYYRLTQDIDLETQTWHCANPKWAQMPKEGRIMLDSVDIEKINIKKKWIAGSIVVPMNQRRARLIMSMFYPNSFDSFLRNGSLNVIFEQREYFESYVMEVKAREMLDTIHGLKERFEQWKSEQSRQLTNYEQLEWFYNQTPYSDSKRYIYPISEVNEEQLRQLSKIWK
ncbi:MAG TPA: M14 family zinc carboxypeptidase [Salinivirgaceae bacterium]|nr:M14 family zinc carboxypeptidase [Salinivirgaceae bacterium]